MRVACIDIGTNTTRLLVAEAAGTGLREIAGERRFTRLGAGRLPDEPIGEERIEAAVKVVATQARAGEEARAERIRAVATASIREAPDRGALLAAIRDATGLEVHVLDGDEEARLAFLGAVRTLPRRPEGVVAVVDVGGGSSEVAVGTFADGATWSHSVAVGSGVLADAHLPTDPPLDEHLDAIRRGADAAFAALPDPPPTAAAFAVGGSANSLRRLAGPTLDEATVQAALQVLCTAHSTEVAARMDLDARRVRLLPAGLLILGAAARRLGHPLELTRGGLREGVAIELLSSLHEGSPDPE